MKEYRGGTLVEKGVYLNKANGELTQQYGKVRVLPGDKDVKYFKIPGILAIIGGPFVGLAFVMFLPFIGITGLIGFLAYKAWHGMTAVGRKIFQPVAIRQEPGMAYLTQRGGKVREDGEGEKAPKADDTGIDELAKEVTKRRQQGEK